MSVKENIGNCSTTVSLSLPVYEGSRMRLPILRNMAPYYLPLKVLTGSKGSSLNILFESSIQSIR